jgi:hypothetical protein
MQTGKQAYGNLIKKLLTTRLAVVERLPTIFLNSGDIFSNGLPTNGALNPE